MRPLLEIFDETSADDFMHIFMVIGYPEPSLKKLAKMHSTRLQGGCQYTGGSGIGRGIRQNP
jgi:hypothetical protein